MHDVIPAPYGEVTRRWSLLAPGTTEWVDASEQQMRGGERPAKCCHNPRFSGLIPCMDIRSMCRSHVATGVVSGGLDRPVPGQAVVLHRAPSPIRPSPRRHFGDERGKLPFERVLVSKKRQSS
jgi:hypothetical protein